MQSGAVPAIADSGACSCRYDGVMEGPMGSAVNATLGQMLDDFFQYAAELQQSLEQQGEAVHAAGDLLSGKAASCIVALQWIVDADGAAVA